MIGHKLSFLFASSEHGCRTIAPMNAVEKFVDIVRQRLGPEGLKAGGGTLYTSASTLARGQTYFLGTNPGGGADSKQSIGDLLAELPASTINEYFDVEWDPQSVRLQHTMKALLRLIAPQNPEAVCASNLIFVRSANVEALPDNFWKLAELCWPAHEHVLDVVQPELVVAYGNGPGSAYDFLRYKLERVAAHKPELAGHGATMCKGFVARRGGRTFNVIGLPHPSRHILRRNDCGDTPNDLNQEVADWIRKFLN